jgi:hypothetical protein
LKTTKNCNEYFVIEPKKAMVTKKIQFLFGSERCEAGWVWLAVDLFIKTYFKGLLLAVQT